MILLIYSKGGQTFLSRAQFKNYFSSQAILFKISDKKVTISANQKKIGSFDALIDSF
jgi:hypothetical protein